MTTRSINATPHEAAALHDGTATAVVRRMELQPHPDFLARGVVSVVPQWPQQDGVRWFMRDGCSELVKCPYGRVGDVLLCKEAWRLRGLHTDACSSVDILANPAHFDVAYCASIEWNTNIYGKVRLPSAMPPWAVRTRRVIASIDVIRVAEMMEDQAKATGLYAWSTESRLGLVYYGAGPADCWENDPRKALSRLYESRHGDGSWATDWAWLIGLTAADAAKGE